MTIESFLFFIGRELQQVAVGAHQIIFHFDHNVALTVESGLEWRGDVEVMRWIIAKESLPQAAPWLRLVGHRISSIQWLEDKSLKLFFENKEELLFFKESDGYESFQITKDGRVWVF